jgi:prepilin-type N-terminal cleavage/methylation domain-containing protein
MKAYTLSRRQQSGFTLVEIAIVLVIIGLLLGGVLKGQKLINSAKAKAVITDFRNTATMIAAYQDRFRALPGDDPSAKQHAAPHRTAHCPGTRRTAPPSHCGHRAARRGRDRALHRPLPQGSHRRAGRHPAAHAGRAPGLPARAGRAPQRGARQHRGTGQADAAMRHEIEHAETKQRLEDLYLPYKQKRRTKAQIAREAGIEPLADALLADPTLASRKDAAALSERRRWFCRRQGGAGWRTPDPDGALRRRRRAARQLRELPGASMAWCASKWPRARRTTPKPPSSATISTYSEKLGNIPRTARWRCSGAATKNSCA